MAAAQKWNPGARSARVVRLSLRYGYLLIDLGSIAGLHAHDHQLAAYCPRCDTRISAG